MKKKQNVVAKIMAGIALGAIVVWIVGTGILFLFTATTSAPSQESISQEELEQLIEQFSGSVDVQETQ